MRRQGAKPDREREREMSLHSSWHQQSIIRPQPDLYLQSMIFFEPSEKKKVQGSAKSPRTSEPDSEKSRCKAKHPFSVSFHVRYSRVSLSVPAEFMLGIDHAQVERV